MTYKHISRKKLTAMAEFDCDAAVRIRIAIRNGLDLSNVELDIVENADGNSVTAGIRIRCVELDTVELMNLNIEFEG